LKGGEWTARYGDQAETSVALDGDIGWSESGTPLSGMHESGNTGDEPIDLSRSIAPALHIPHAEFHRPIDIDVLVVRAAVRRLRGGP
jgi:hypothetical protein